MNEIKICNKTLSTELIFAPLTILKHNPFLSSIQKKDIVRNKIINKYKKTTCN